MFKKELEYIKTHKSNLEMVSFWDTTKDKSETVLNITYSNTPIVIVHNKTITIKANEAMNSEELNEIFISLENYTKGEVTVDNTVIFSNQLDKHDNISVILSFKKE